MKKIKIKVAHKDARGDIADIFYKTRIEHVAVINSKKGALRGDHYHTKSTQSMYMAKGGLKYYYQKFDKAKNKPVGKIRSIMVNEGEMVTTPPYEIHALEFLGPNTFIVFSQGLRGGKDYEKDTFRVKPSLIPRKRRLDKSI